ncbi:C-type lectin domain family 12 member B-like [Malaclemys terrapin pileata]|uniref:C-type lectin domain family 12 member B-like n=1 Tax=Malaclemys terrapin pileata TaxID=2991368 RepID=UPI0023A866E7|nr:C-type lectin domain family 12 member B-like [Malaclemys terrapin pileata]
MSEEEDLKFQSSSEHQRQKPKNAGNKDSLTPSPSWLSMAVVLGVLSLCLLLLITARILGAKLTQWGGQQEVLTQQVENLTQQLKVCQSQTTNHQGDKCPVQWIRWIQSSDSLYLFAAATRTWEQCQSYYSSQSAQLLKTENEEEKNFIQQESYLYFEIRQGFRYYFPFWIGLLYDSSTRKWVWVDSTALSSGLLEIPEADSQHYRGGACAYIQGGNFKAGACGETRSCLCKKMKDLTKT